MFQDVKRGARDEKGVFSHELLSNAAEIECMSRVGQTDSRVHGR